MRRVQVTVRGRVHGVGFRAGVRSVAARNNLAGWVRNLPDARVEAEVEGQASAVEELLAWMRRGPALSRVDHVAVREIAPLGTGSFEVR